MFLMKSEYHIFWLKTNGIFTAFWDNSFFTFNGIYEIIGLTNALLFLIQAPDQKTMTVNTGAWIVHKMNVLH